MIEFIQHNESKVSAYQDGNLISSQVYTLQDGSFTNDNDILVSLEDLSSEIIDQLPTGTGFFMTKGIPDTNFMVTRIDKHEHENALEIEVTADRNTFYDSIWNANRYIKRFWELNSELEVVSVDFEDLEYPMIVLTFNDKYENRTTIGDLLQKAFYIIRSITSLVELELKGFKWKERYESDEMLFCNEVITPLLRKMDLLNFEFTHGISENGKDYVFSESTRFGTIRHSAVQVKAGNITGSANGKLKEIIEQLDDAFMIPFEQLNSEERKFIDTFYVVTSGKITSQAIEKIKAKIKPELKGSVKFLDKYNILSLVDKYWQ